MFIYKKKRKKVKKYLMNECERVWCCVVCERRRALKVNVVNNKLQLLSNQYKNKVRMSISK